MTPRHSLGFLTSILLAFLVACGPSLERGADLRGRNLQGRDLRGADLAGANLSDADLRNAKMGFVGDVKPEQVFRDSGYRCHQWLKGGHLLALCDKESIKIWEMEKAAFAQTLALPGGQNTKVLAVSPDGGMLLLETLDSLRIGRLSLWDANTDSSYPIAFPGDAGHFAWSPDGSYLLIGDTEITWIWDAVHNGLAGQAEYQIQDLSWSNDGSMLAYVQDDRLQFWNMTTDDRDRTYGIPATVGYRLDWSPDDTQILVSTMYAAGQSPLGQILEAESGAYLQDLENVSRVCEGCSLDFVAWSPIQALIAGGSGNTMVIWNAETGSILRTVEAPRGGCCRLQWSSDGRFLLSSGADVLVWDVAKLLRTTNLAGADMSRANLSGADLAGLDLSRAILTGANLSGANLRGANLSGLDLRTVTLAGADLSGANLTNADLSGVDLTGVVFEQAALENAKLADANLAGAMSLEYVLKGVCKGDGLPAMPLYSDQPGIHPLAVLNSYGGRHEWNADVPDKWRPANDRLPEIVACVGVAIARALHHCSYMQSGPVPVLLSSSDVVVRVANSGSILGSTTIEGPRETCPLQIMRGTQSLGGAHPKFSDAAPWLAQFVER